MKKRLCILILSTVILVGCGKQGVSELTSVEAVSISSEVSETAAKDATTEAVTENVDKNPAVEDQKQENEAVESSSAKADEKDPLTIENKEQKEETKEETKEQTKEQTKEDYGRIIFTGDSRTVDLFDGGVIEIYGGSYNGITVFCKDACQSDYMINAVNNVGLDNFDTLVSWMGCNDYGNFEPYVEFYESILNNGKKLVLCTVGPTDDSTLANDFDRTYYTNDRQLAYNAALLNWANGHSVKVIDLYSYISSNPDISINPEDGIHFLPQPTTVIWNYILGALN